MDNVHFGYFFYPISKFFNDFVNSDRNIEYLSKLSNKSKEEIKSFFIKMTKDSTTKSISIELDWVIMNMQFYFSSQKKDDGDSQYPEQFRKHIVLEIEFYGFKSEGDPYISTYQDGLKLYAIIRELFTRSNAIYGFFPATPEKSDFYPNEKDITQGKIAMWVNQNLFSKRKYNKIQPEFLPPENIFMNNILEDKVVELLDESEEYYLLRYFISNEKFYNDRFSKKKLASEEIEKKIQIIIDQTKKNMSGIDYDGLRALGIPQDRILSIVRDLTEYCWSCYEKYGGDFGLPEAIYGYKILKDKKGTIKAINEYIKRYEKTQWKQNLLNIKSVLKWNEMKIDDVLEISPETYKKLKRYIPNENEIT